MDWNFRPAISKKKLQDFVNYILTVLFWDNLHSFHYLLFSLDLWVFFNGLIILVISLAWIPCCHWVNQLETSQPKCSALTNLHFVVTSSFSSATNNFFVLSRVIRAMLYLQDTEIKERVLFLMVGWLLVLILDKSNINQPQDWIGDEFSCRGSIVIVVENPIHKIIT